VVVAVSFWPCAIALLVLAASVAPAPVHADSASTEARYRALVDEALAELASQHWSEARVLFEEAHALSPSAQTLRALGVSAFELRRYGTATEELRASLEDERRPLSDAQRSEVEELLARAARFVGELELLGLPDGASVSVDGKPIQIRADALLQLDPGSHLVIVRTPDGDAPPFQREVDVSAGQRTVLAVEPTTAAPPPEESKDDAVTPSASATPVAPGSVVPIRPKPKARAWSLSMAATAVALGTTAGGLAWLTRERHQEFAACRADCADLAQRGQRSERATNAVAALAVAAGAAALGLWIRGRRAALSPAAALTPSAGDLYLGLQLRVQ
jgi:hypothetical protein